MGKEGVGKVAEIWTAVRDQISAQNGRCGVMVTLLGTVFEEQIRGRRKTRLVKRHYRQERCEKNQTSTCKPLLFVSLMMGDHVECFVLKFRPLH